MSSRTSARVPPTPRPDDHVANNPKRKRPVVAKRTPTSEYAARPTARSVARRVVCCWRTMVGEQKRCFWTSSAVIQLSGTRVGASGDVGPAFDLLSESLDGVVAIHLFGARLR